MMNVYHVDRNFVILHLLKINVKIKSAVARIWKDRDINCVMWDPSHTKRFFLPIAHGWSHTTRWLLSHDMIEIASDRIGGKNSVIWERLYLNYSIFDEVNRIYYLKYIPFMTDHYLTAFYWRETNVFPAGRWG